MLFLFVDKAVFSAQASFKHSHQTVSFPIPALTGFTTASHIICFVPNTHSPGFCKQMDYQDPG